MKNYPTFATYKVGDGRDMLTELEKSGCHIISETRRLMSQRAYLVWVAREEETVTLCSATVEQLTGKGLAHIEKVRGAIIAAGYDLCWPEDGPRLREVYRGRKMVYSATERSLCCSDGRHYIFYLAGTGGKRLALCTIYLASVGWWSGDSLFVFRKRSDKKN